MRRDNPGLIWNLLNSKTEWKSSDIRKNEKINVDKEFDEKKPATNVLLKWYVYFKWTKTMSKRKEFRTSVHHILPRSMWGSSEETNLEELREGYHRAIHTLFANKMIAEQLITTIDISAKALRDDVKDWLIETLTSRDIDNPYEWYIPEAIK